MAKKRRKAAGKPTILGLLVLVALCAVYALTQMETWLPQAKAEPLPEAAEAGAAVYFLDVGQGDSAFIRIGDFTMLIDAGVHDAADTIIDSLEALGVETLSAAVATHPHADHIGGMRDVLRRFGAEQFYMTVLPDDQTPTTRTYERLLDTLEEENIPAKRVTTGMALEAPENTTIEVLSPGADEVFDEVNDYSAVLRLTYGAVSFLFTGDAETPVEENMLRENEPLSAAVLKCGHHGSSSSSSRDFLRAVQPQYAVISCARNNDYGHPHHETLESLEALEIPALRTDRLGTIAFVTDGAGLSAYTWSAAGGLSPLEE